MEIESKGLIVYVDASTQYAPIKLGTKIVGTAIRSRVYSAGPNWNIYNKEGHHVVGVYNLSIGLRVLARELARQQ